MAGAPSPPPFHAHGCLALPSLFPLARRSQTPKAHQAAPADSNHKHAPTPASTGKPGEGVVSPGDVRSGASATPSAAKPGASAPASAPSGKAAAASQKSSKQGSAAASPGDDGASIPPTPGPGSLVVEGSMAEQLVADAFSESGVKGLVELVSEREDDVEVLTAAFELLASACAGSEDARGTAYATDALVKALSAMKLFEWQPALQAGAIKFIANMAADYAKPAGKQGAVESVVSTMRASADSYQVQLHGVRALGLLIKERDNLVRARAAGADEVIATVLDMHAGDGQLVYRAGDLQSRLETITEAEATEAVARVPESSKNPWSRLKQAVFTGQAKKISEGMLPGMHGISGQVAAKMQEGVEPLLNYMVERMRSAEAVRWCCDALATMCAGNGECFVALAARGAQRTRTMAGCTDAPLLLSRCCCCC